MLKVKGVRENTETRHAREGGKEGGRGRESKKNTKIQINHHAFQL